MRQFSFLTRVVSSSLSVALFVGCGKTPDPVKKPEPQTASKGHDEHAHAEHGPHKGLLIELGKEEYHAELVHDDAAGTVTIYILDSHAKQPVPIVNKDLVINLKHDGKGKQFRLVASPVEADKEGQSSRFVSSDKELSEDLDRKGTEARLVVEIEGQSFTGDIKHEHANDGKKPHDHQHDKK